MRVFERVVKREPWKVEMMAAEMVEMKVAH